ncbi:MAG: BRCT domain-containing protein [Solidesulfovibrio sp. DCME]|uniref:BRCT domain-containing protein n=1 Tax=Solidesulfovibrio sp. DCME TaxID=3447380 RepID=UPI003D123AC1
MSFTFDPDIDLDDYGQPKSRALNATIVKRRNVNELIGICKGLIADKIVNDDEARFLQDWLEENKDVIACWPGNVLYARVYEYLRDGVITPLEREDLFRLLREFSGLIPGRVDLRAATAIPFDTPPPQILYENRTFVLTGRFAYGTREQCIDAIHDLCGWVRPAVLAETDYVVVGTLASRDWACGSYGRKIETAMFWKEKGREIAIVSEDHWVESLTI